MPLLRTDPFNAVLLNSEPLAVSEEQRSLIKEILDISSSDSRLAEKAYVAIWRVLTVGSVEEPVVSSLNPGSATIGDPSFTLHVLGTGFNSESLIVWNGSEEPTTYVSATELTTGVDMSTAVVAVNIPVAVLNSDGVMSEASTFVIQDGVSGLVAKSAPVKSLPPEYPKASVKSVDPLPQSNPKGVK